MTADDVPTDFFIVLRGDVGVFTPRNYTMMKKEHIYLDKLLSALGTADVSNEELKKFVKDSYLQKVEVEFFSNLREVVDGKVVYKAEYLSVKLGGLSKEDFDRKLVFSEVAEASPSQASSKQTWSAS